jgi:Na+/H+-dicarboxylate symporter
MNNPIMLNGATIFGMSNGKLLGGGESGAEMIVGRDSLMNMIRTAAGGTNNVNVSVVVNGNVDDYEALANTIADKINDRVLRDNEVYA